MCEPVQYDKCFGSRTARLSLCCCNILQLTAADNVGLTCISVYFRNWTKWKQRQQQRQQPDEGSRQDRLIDDDVEDMADIPDGELCVVCLLRRRRAAFLHCGHRVCCVGCAQHVEQGDNPRCPVCRQTVTGIVRVFDS
jgi:hypothetical protein